MASCAGHNTNGDQVSRQNKASNNLRTRSRGRLKHGADPLPPPRQEADLSAMVLRPGNRSTWQTFTSLELRDMAAKPADK